MTASVPELDRKSRVAVLPISIPSMLADENGGVSHRVCVEDKGKWAIEGPGTYASLRTFSFFFPFLFPMGRL